MKKINYYTLCLSSSWGVAFRDSSSVTYKNTLLGLTTRAPTRILEILRVYIFITLAFHSFALQAAEQLENKSWFISQALEKSFEDITIKELENALNSLNIFAKSENFENYLLKYKILEGKYFSVYLAPTFFRPDQIWILENPSSFTAFEDLNIEQLRELESFRYLIGAAYQDFMGYDGYAMFMDLKKDYGLGPPALCLEMIPTKLAGPHQNEVNIKEKIERNYYMVFDGDKTTHLSPDEAVKKIGLIKTFLTDLQANKHTLDTQIRKVENTLPWKRKTTHWNTLQKVCLSGLEQELEKHHGLVSYVDLSHSKNPKKQEEIIFKQDGGEFTNGGVKDIEIKTCAFCNPDIINNQLVYRFGDFDCLYNFRPYKLGYHFMILPHPPVHIEQWQNFSLQDVLQMDQFAQAVVKALKQESGRDDVILFVQNGMSAGMTAPHSHMHILLRPIKLHYYAQVLLEATNHKRKGLSPEEMKPVKEKFKTRLEFLLSISHK